MTFWIINKIIAAYILSTTTFLIIILFLKTQRKRTRYFLNKANLLIVFVLFLNIIFVGEETIRCLVSENSNAKVIVEETVSNHRQNCTSVFIALFFFAFLFQSLFFFKRHRIKVSFTIISIILLTFVYNFERLVVYVTSLFRDYLPSSWSTYYETTGLVWTVVFSAVYFALCWTSIETFKNKYFVKQ